MIAMSRHSAPRNDEEIFTVMPPSRNGEVKASTAYFNS